MHPNVTATLESITFQSLNHVLYSMNHIWTFSLFIQGTFLPNSSLSCRGIIHPHVWHNLMAGEENVLPLTLGLCHVTCFDQWVLTDVPQAEAWNVLIIGGPALVCVTMRRASPASCLHFQPGSQDEYTWNRTEPSLQQGVTPSQTYNLKQFPTEPSLDELNPNWPRAGKHKNKCLLLHASAFWGLTFQCCNR